MTITEQINRLIRVPKNTALPPLAARPAIGKARGSAAYTAPPAIDIVAAVLRKEVITVYSHLIITEDGAFERPLNWPIDGNYPVGTPIPNPLPGSLIDNNGQLQLDIDVQHYEQRRAHLVVFEVEDVLHEDQLLVPLATPFLLDGAYQGLTHLAGNLWRPQFAIEVLPGAISTPVQARLNALQAAIL